MNENFDDIDFVPLKVIEKNILSRSTRQAKETKEELHKVLNRVDNICGEFEKPPLYPIEFSLNSFIANKNSGKDDDSTGVEVVKDVFALEQLLSSKQNREKYVKQVTVFIVGYSKVATDRLQLMQEVNQFFMNSDDMFDSFFEREEKILSKTTEAVGTENNEQFFTIDYPEENYTVPELAENVKQAVESCQVLTNRLAELNTDMVDCLYKYAQNKAGNKGKKKLEKSLEDALTETAKINEKLAQSLKVISDKDSKIENLIKQCEMKSKEVQKYKAAAESIKKTAMESEKLKEKIIALEEQILGLQSELAQSQLKIEQTKTLEAAQRANAEETALEIQEKCKNLEKLLEQQKIDFEEAKRSMKRQHATEIKQIQAENEQNMQQMKELHQQEIQQLKSSEFDENAIALQWSEPEDEYRKQESTMSKNSPVGKKKVPSSGGTHSRTESSKLESRQKTNVDSEPSDGKDVMIFSDAPNLDDEQFWSSVPRNHLLGRFAQYRQLSMASLSNFLDEIDNLKIINTRQIHSLKSQHQIHKRRWDQEREMLIEAVRTTENDKKEVQSYADMAMQEIENLISILKLTEKEIGDSARKYSESKKELGLLEQVEQVKVFLEQNESTDISIPRLTTLIELHRNSKQTILKASETQTENEKKLTELRSQHVPRLDENKDILFPDEVDEEVGTRSVAVSASPTLVRIAFYNRENSLNEAKYESQGVTAKDLEVPSGMVDVEDRTGLNLIQHPIVKDYLQTYDHILTFKEQFLSILQNMDKSQAPEVVNLRQLDVITIRSRNRIIPQIEEMGRSIERTLQISTQIIERQLVNKNKIDSKLPNETKTQRISQRKEKQITTPGKLTSSVHIGLLQEHCRELKKIIKNFQQSYQSKFSFLNNAILKCRQLIMILNKLYTEKLSEIEEMKSRQQNSDKEMINDNMMKVPSHQPFNLDSVSIFFNRRDTERNIGRMQHAILFNEFPQGFYHEAIERMSSYTEISVKQLHVLVRKYLYNDAMKKIAEFVRKNHSFTADTFKILDKMEVNIRKKQDRYKDIQDYLSKQRILRAKELLDTFEKIENESSIFMIKPTLSMKSKQFINQFIEEYNLTSDTEQLKQKLSERFRFQKQHKCENPDRVSSPSPDNSPTWKPDSSIDPTRNENYLYESRLAEMDINRMLLPLNNVSVPYSKMGLSGNETYLPPQVAVRSYMAMSHPILVNNEYISHKSTSLHGSPNKSEVSSKSRTTRDLSKHIPLPPITSLEFVENEIASILHETEITTSKENNPENVY